MELLNCAFLEMIYFGGNLFLNSTTNAEMLRRENLFSQRRN